MWWSEKPALIFGAIKRIPVVVGACFLIIVMLACMCTFGMFVWPKFLSERLKANRYVRLGCFASYPLAAVAAFFLGVPPNFVAALAIAGPLMVPGLLGESRGKCREAEPVEEMEATPIPEIPELAGRSPMPRALGRHRCFAFLSSTVVAFAGFGLGVFLRNSGYVSGRVAEVTCFGLFLLGALIGYWGFVCLVGVRCIDPKCAGKMYLVGGPNHGAYRCPRCGRSHDFSCHGD